MRIGFNPNKDKPQESNDFFHQIVIPVYIPDQEGYFKESFKILQYCLESVFKTVHQKTYITVVNNGSHDDVVEYLNELQKDGKIQEVIHSTNIGKLNAIVKGISGHDFTFITVADCDVLFLKDWQKETYAVFEKFSKTGTVCPTPSSRSLKSYTFNIWFELLFSKSLRFRKVKNPEALKAFAASVGKPNMYSSLHLEKYLTVANGNFKAVPGAGHFLATYRKEVFEKMEIKHSAFMLGGDSEEKFLDLPVVKNGMWRLSTEDNFAYHLGNVEEKWMQETLEQIKPNDFFPVEPPVLRKIKSSEIAFLLKYKVFSRIITQKMIWQYCLKLKGLSREEVLQYTRKYE
ncbi:glycosyltransferase family A protein [Flavobacterium sp. Fl-318]|uniref:Glycosyltransferase family A protein n=1 Tax=Flavobacterium cupriresistens TaxID=2893885 RepID=A0ABU4RBY1_9FLAO|nr:MULTISPECIES: glycosyltransferase family A protein [unclassified Flavobacterium]MDX6190092.1 glycosyltransferase family A protein [Flavobacterium sp. Fl-318]UFH42914.1 glycosyltransferase family 2 protein [Flavobacterium sp. F-323]